jgi:CheY-like chemotaxis protein
MSTSSKDSEVPGSRTVPRRCRVLLVDDDLDFRSALRRLLGRDFELEEAAGGGEALALLLSGTDFDAMVLDADMPGMNGKETLEAVHNIDPRLANATVVLTAGPASAELGEWVRTVSIPVLRKPASRAELLSALGCLEEQKRKSGT